MVPGWSAATTRVVTRASRSNANSAAAVVSVLFVDAGCSPRSSSWRQSSSPVIASVTRPPSLPRLGSATTAASVAASADWVGSGAVAATGTMLGLAVTAGGGGGGRGWDRGAACAGTAGGEQRSCRDHGGNDRQHAERHDQMRRRPPLSGTHNSPDFFAPIVPKHPPTYPVREPR